MPVTLADLRALTERALTHTENPAILRLPERERTVEGLDRAYQPRILSFVRPNGFREKPDWMNGNSAWQIGGEGWTLRPADPGTSHTLLVALALARGYDPGVGALDVRWGQNERDGERYWFLETSGGGCQFYGRYSVIFHAHGIHAPTVATEPDAIRALELAVRHVLEGR